MWKMLGKPKTQKVTRALAVRFSEMDPAPQDRPLSERRLQIYERILREGLFRPVTWATAKCAETGGIYRINGKHTSVMLSGMEQVPDFYVIIEHYHCDTLEDVAKLYATFDTKLAVRTTADINRSFAASIPELADKPGWMINTAVSGISYHLWFPNYQTVPAPQRAEMALMEHTDAVIWLHDILTASPKPRHMCRSAVVAAMFGCYQKSKRAATEFWEAVRDETGIKPQLPDRKLAKFLLVNSVAVGNGGNQTMRRKADMREFYVKCIHGWNAWRKGEATDLKYYAGRKIPSFR